MIIKKITCGFVIQTFDTGKGENVCVHQEFIAGDPVDFENKHGAPIDNDGLTDPLYFPFNMEQPEKD